MGGWQRPTTWRTARRHRQFRGKPRRARLKQPLAAKRLQRSRPPTNTTEVTADLQARDSGNQLSVLADNASFGTDFNFGRSLFLQVDCAIDGVALRQRFRQGSTVALPGPLTLVSAQCGEFLSPGTLDVTRQVAQLVNNEGGLLVEPWFAR